MSESANMPPVIAPPIVTGPLRAAPKAAGRKRRRWWLYVLGTLAGMFALGLATLVGIGIYWNSLVKNFTSTTPKNLPELGANPQELEALAYRVKQFRESLSKDQSLAPLSFTSRDINLLLSQNREFKDRVWLVVTNGQVEGEFSIPLDRTGFRNLRGRHLNGTVTLAAGLQEDGFLMFKITGIKLNGKVPPAWLLQQLKKINFMDPLNNQRETVILLQSIESVTVEDGDIRISPVNPLIPDPPK